MVREVRSDKQNGVALITLDRPVANILSPTLRSGLAEALEGALGDAGVGALVLTGAGQGFSAGVDIAEFDGPLAAPWVADLCAMIEDSPKPVVAALHGFATGAGLELALAAHARIATAETRLALPDVRLGMTPGAGATQRLPRLVGAQRALELLLTGQAVEAGDARARHLVDEIAERDPVAAALAAARSLAARGEWTRTSDCRRGFSDPEGYQKAVAEVAEQLDDDAAAARDILSCVEAAQLLPFSRGLTFERVKFEESLTLARARGPRHAAIAERRAGIMPELSRGRAAPVERVALQGTGTIAAELAVVCLDAGLHVRLAAPDAAQAAAIRERVARVLDSAVARGRLPAEAGARRLARLSGGDATAETDAGADLVLETGRGGGGAVRAHLGNGGAEAGGAVALHMYRPAHTRRMAELSVPAGTGDDAVATVARFLSRLGKTVVKVAPEAGRLEHQLDAALFAAALALAAAGASPVRIDGAARELGLVAGPFARMDRLGLPEADRRLSGFADPQEEADLPGRALLSERIAQGATGRAAGRGFFRYVEGQARPEPVPSAAPDGGEVQEMSDADLAAALHAALVNRAAGLIADGTVQRASDIDVVVIRGFGFDRSRGGPLLQADLRGIFPVYQAMKRFADLSAAVWRPHARIEEMVKYGEGFFGRAG